MKVLDLLFFLFACFVAFLFGRRETDEGTREVRFPAVGPLSFGLSWPKFDKLKNWYQFINALWQKLPNHSRDSPQSLEALRSNFGVPLEKVSNFGAFFHFTLVSVCEKYWLELHFWVLWTLQDDLMAKGNRIDQSPRRTITTSEEGKKEYLRQGASFKPCFSTHVVTLHTDLC